MHGTELGAGDLRVDGAARPTVWAGDDVFLAGEFGERDDAVGDQFRELDAFRGSFRSVQSYLRCLDCSMNALCVLTRGWDYVSIQR